MEKNPPKSVDELLARYAAGERNFVGAELDYATIDLSNTILDGADFSGSWFCASFQNASLRGAKFCCANVKTSDFSGADLTNADFSDASLEATVWKGAILSGTRFANVSLFGCQMTVDEFLEFIAA